MVKFCEIWRRGSGLERVQDGKRENLGGIEGKRGETEGENDALRRHEAKRERKRVLGASLESGRSKRWREAGTEEWEKEEGL